MTNTPLILVSPNIEKKGDEFGDVSISLSETYQLALMGADVTKIEEVGRGDPVRRRRCSSRRRQTTESGKK